MNVKITIEGPVGDEKELITNLISDTLSERGFCVYYDEHPSIQGVTDMDQAIYDISGTIEIELESRDVRKDPNKKYRDFAEDYLNKRDSGKL